MCLPSGFRVLMSVAISARIRFSVRLFLLFFVEGLMSYLRYFCLFAYGGVQHILCWFLVFFVLYIPCCQFLWIGHF